MFGKMMDMCGYKNCNQFGLATNSKSFMIFVGVVANRGEHIT